MHDIRAMGIPRLYAAASLKPAPCEAPVRRRRRRIPRLYAAASLKQSRRGAFPCRRCWYSAALCRGLIEARVPILLSTGFPQGIPRLYAAASLKLMKHRALGTESAVFRGSMPRPH